VRQRNPIQTAKLGALVDQVSNGRFLFGVGGGWNRMKWRTTGTVFESRFKAMRERTEAMRENRQMARDAGRNLETLSVTFFNPAEDEGELARYRDMGVARVVPMLPSEESDKICRSSTAGPS
jgi:alkanesulfonate monooxygenase SsuD/methylene tetrahydromethanopterin reductase-like flavin-dependent oxidoreductase (luciferase family)